MNPDALKRLSTLLDAALELPEPQRGAWLDALSGESLALAPKLRDLLARHASRETAELIDRAPVFTVAGEDPGAALFKAGEAIGRYRLVSELGRGGMGEVWLAELLDGDLKRSVALKLPMLIARRSVLVQRFARERDILGSLTHPHIARLYDAGLADDGQPYLALEYVRGQPITSYCELNGMEARGRVSLLRQVTDAVQYAHANLVIHRDLKAGNVLVTAEGQAMLLDFGIAKLLQDEQGQAPETELTQLGGRALTLACAAPEQVSGAPVSIATDVYALGALLYELLSGRQVFQAETRAALEQAVLSSEPTRPSQGRQGVIARLPRGLAADLDSIVLKALKKAPQERYATVNAFADDLDRFLRGEAVLAQPDRLGYRLNKFVSRNRVPVLTGSLVAVALVSVSAVALIQANEARQQARAAQLENKRAQAVQGFLLDIFRANSNQQAEPLAAQATTARELLDIGADRIAETLKAEPESQLAVRETLAEMYLQLGLSDRAAKISEGSLDLARRTFGTRSPRLAEFLLDHAAALQERPNRSQVPVLLTEAIQVLDAAGASTSPTRGTALLEIAWYWDGESLARSREAADAAVEFFRQHHPQARALVPALIAAGRARTNAGDHAAAEAMYRAAVEAARRQGATASTLQHDALNHLGDAQRGLMRYREAEASYRAALEHATKAYGPGRGETLVTGARLAGLLMTIGRRAEFEEARRAAQFALDQPDARLDGGWRTAVSGMFADLLPEYGRPDLAEPLVRSDVEDLRRKYPRAGITARSEQKLASVLMTLGRLDDARTTLAQAVERWARVTEGSGPVPVDAMFTLAGVRLGLARGDAAQALSQLEALNHATPIDRLWSQLERGRALAAVGRQREAMEAARSVLQELAGLPTGYRPVVLESDAHLLLGQAGLDLGNAKAAEPDLRAALELRLRHDLADSLWVARAQIALSQCEAQLGRREVARQLLAEAQRIHEVLGVAAKPQADSLASARALLTDPGNAPSKR